ncbi:MAG: hypothetical protein CMF46_04200 [Legionellales bacterium]|nr:hypothetical protein [Legionellales bacterium]|tara:strand:- start:869 stop:2221 length:1353 start_codon:yes stop_codon:yes gene_type:complete
MNNNPKLRLSALEHTGLVNLDSVDHVEVLSASIDSRSCQKGDAFFAITGQRHNGHDYARQAVDQGAHVLIVEQPLALTTPQIIVNNTALALLQLSVDYLSQFSVTTIAITGSCGKTSTKNILKQLLECYGSVLASPKSYNNRIGVALTLLQLTPENRFLILEFGTSQVGEILELTSMIKPDRRLLLGASLSHLSGLGSIEGVVNEKGSILTGMLAHQVAIINHQSPYAQQWRRCMSVNARVINYASPDSTIQIESNGQGSIHLTAQGVQRTYNYALLGQHQIDNLSAALTCVESLNLDVTTCFNRIELIQPVERRLELKRLNNGLAILDDSYNANVGSWAAALAVLDNYSLPNRLVVMSDIDDLGHASQAIHEMIITMMSQSSIKALITLGPICQQAAKKFARNTMHFDDNQALIRYLGQLSTADTVVLFKASRVGRLDTLVDQIIEVIE